MVGFSTGGSIPGTQTDSSAIPCRAPKRGGFPPRGLGAQQAEARSQSDCIIPGMLPRFRLRSRLPRGTSLTFLPSLLRTAKAGPPALSVDGLSDIRLYRDPGIDYQQLVVVCHAPRWLHKVRRYGCLSQD